MSKTLECSVFDGRNPLTGKLIWDHRVGVGTKAIREKLISDYHWDGSSSVATIAANLSEDGLVQEWQLHLFGKSKGAKLDASTFFFDQEEGNYLRIKEMALDNLVFRGNMVSEWVAPDKYQWEYRLPHETDPKKYYGVKESDMAQYKAMPLWLRASCQVIPGPKLQVYLGCAPAEHRVTDLRGSSDKAFPLIFVEKFNIPFLPFEASDMELGMGPIPFLIDSRDHIEFSEVTTMLPDGQAVKEGMSKYFQTATKPNQRNEIGTWTKEVANGSWVARAPNYTWPDPRPLAGDSAEGEGDDDDEAGQQYNFCKHKWIILWLDKLT